MSPRAEVRPVAGCPRCTLRQGGVAGVLTAGALAVGLLLAAAPGALAAPPASVLTTTTSPGESWAAELALDGGDDSGVVLGDGGVRLAPGSPGRPFEGVLTLAPRRLASPTKELEGVLTADLPVGTGVDVQARGLDRRGVWTEWLGTRAGSPARLGTPTVDVQVRLLLHGGPDGTTTPVVREVWLTARTLPAPVATTRPTTTTVPTTTRPTTTRPAPPPRPGPPRPVPPGPPTTTTTSPTTTTSTPGTSPAALWNGAIATTGLSGFKDTPYNITGSSSVRVVDGPPKTIRITVPSGSQRAEIEPDVPEFSEGQTRYFGLTYVLPPSFPTDPQGFQLATQWKNDGTGSPPLELRVEKGRFVLGGGFGRPGGSRLFATDIAPVVTGRPVEIVVGIRFSSDPDQGQVDVWLDGDRKITGFRPPGGTLYPGKSSYWKVGLYRDTGNAGTATVDLLAAALGTSYDSVRGGPGTTTSSLAGMAACGPSYQSIYEGDARFEHCYALDDASDIPLTRKASCWNDWRSHYTAGQPRDRVEYASARASALTRAGVAPTDDSLMQAAPGGGTTNQVLAPEATNAFAPPPNTLEAMDGGSAMAVANGPQPLGNGSVAARPPAPSAIDAGAVIASDAPGSSCASTCGGTRDTCKTSCTGTKCTSCDSSYKRCMRACFN